MYTYKCMNLTVKARLISVRHHSNATDSVKPFNIHALAMFYSLKSEGNFSATSIDSATGGLGNSAQICLSSSGFLIVWLQVQQAQVWAQIYSLIGGSRRVFSVLWIEPRDLFYFSSQRILFPPLRHQQRQLFPDQSFPRRQWLRHRPVRVHLA